MSADLHVFDKPVSLQMRLLQKNLYSQYLIVLIDAHTAVEALRIFSSESYCNHL